MFQMLLNSCRCPCVPWCNLFSWESPLEKLTKMHAGAKGEPDLANLKKKKTCKSFIHFSWKGCKDVWTTSAEINGTLKMLHFSYIVFYTCVE